MLRIIQFRTPMPPRDVSLVDINRHGRHVYLSHLSIDHNSHLVVPPTLSLSVSTSVVESLR